MKNILSKLFILIVCFAFVSVVSAKSGSGTIKNGGSAFELIENCGKFVTGRFYTNSISGKPFVQVDAQKKVLIVWVTQATTLIPGDWAVGRWYPTYFEANASGNVRMLWSNTSNSSSSITANFELY